VPPVSVVFANYSLTGFQPLGSIFISSGNSFYNLPKLIDFCGNCLTS